MEKLCSGWQCHLLYQINNKESRGFKKMRGTVHWFNNQKGYGFLKSEEGKDVFLHYSNIVMEGFKELEENDVVNYELGVGNDGREQAVNVTPIVTTKMIEKALKEDNLYMRTMKDSHGVKKYLVVNVDNVIQSSEEGMTFSELATYAEMPVEIAAMTTTIKE